MITTAQEGLEHMIGISTKESFISCDISSFRTRAGAIETEWSIYVSDTDGDSSTGYGKTFEAALKDWEAKQ